MQEVARVLCSTHPCLRASAPLLLCIQHASEFLSITYLRSKLVFAPPDGQCLQMRHIADVAPIFLPHPNTINCRRYPQTGSSVSFVTVFLPKQHPSASPNIVTAATHNPTTSTINEMQTTSAMNENQPSMGPYATSQPSARPPTSTWPLVRHPIWQGLTDKSIWMAAVIINIAMMIITACLSPTSFSVFGLVNGITLIVVPTYIATNVILIPILKHLLGSFFWAVFFSSKRARARPPVPSA